MAGITRYILNRVAQTIVTLFIFLTVVFFLFEALPQYSFYFGGGSRWERYLTYLGRMLTFDFGDSLSSGQPVWETLGRAIMLTILLFGLTLLISYVLGTVIGAISAWHRGKVRDGAVVFTSLCFYTMPPFWLGMILIFLLGYRLGWFPWAGFYDPSSGLPYAVDVLWHIALPLLTLVLLTIASNILLMRTSMLEIMEENYIKSAIARGLQKRRVLFRHAARNALLPVVTSFVVSLSVALTNVIIIERVFSFPGAGYHFIQSLTQLDFPVAQAAMYLLCLIVLLGNLFIDILYTYLDPRISLQGGGA